MKTAEKFVNEKLGDKNYTHSPYSMYRKEIIEWLEEYRSQSSGQTKSTENIKDFVKKFMQSYEPDTFIPNKYGQYVYRSENGASGLNLVAFFEDLLDEYAQSHQVEMPSDGNLARNLHNWSDTHLDGDITLKDCYELINYFETLRKSGTLTLIR